MEEPQFPLIPASLIEALDKLYPNRSPQLTWSDREIWWKGGQRQVVDFLREQYDRQSENIVNTKVI